MKKLLKMTLRVACLAGLLALPFQASAILLTPSSSSLLLSGPESSQSAIDAVLEAAFPGLTSQLLYKNDAPSTEEGSFAGSYNTTYNNPDLADSDARISFVVGQPYINANPVYTLIKDGNSSPNWYLFDISGWNGTDNIDFEGFFAGTGPQGNPQFQDVSHVTIYATHVPDGGATLISFGLALVGLGTMRRFVKN